MMTIYKEACKVQILSSITKELLRPWKTPCTLSEQSV